MPSIAHIANLWSLVGHPSPAKEWSLEKKIKAIAAAGFDGITTRVTPEHRRLAEKHGLRHILGFISTDDPTEFADRLREQKEAGAVHINVQLDNHDTPPALATKHSSTTPNSSNTASKPTSALSTATTAKSPSRTKARSHPK